MRLPRFEYRAPSTLEEALSLLEGGPGEAQALAGGTDLLVMLKNRLNMPKYVVNLKGLTDLNFITQTRRKGVTIGALTPLWQVASSPILRGPFQALSQAAGRVASPSLRYLATLGGNICLDTKCLFYNQSLPWQKARAPCFKREGDQCYVVKGGKKCQATCAADTVPALIALGAEVRIVSRAADRYIPLERFFTGDGKSVNILQPGEVITEVQIPPAPASSSSAFSRLSEREAIDFAMASVAVMVSYQGDHKVGDARIVLSALAPAPQRAKQAEGLLQGKALDEDLLEEVGEAASREARPVLNSICPHIPAGVRRAMVKGLVKRALRQVMAKSS